MKERLFPAIVIGCLGGIWYLAGMLALILALMACAACWLMGEEEAKQ